MRESETALLWASFVLALSALVYTILAGTFVLVPLWLFFVTYWTIRLVQTRKSKRR